MIFNIVNIVLLFLDHGLTMTMTLEVWDLRFLVLALPSVAFFTCVWWGQQPCAKTRSGEDAFPVAKARRSATLAGLY